MSRTQTHAGGEKGEKEEEQLPPYRDELDDACSPRAYWLAREDGTASCLAETPAPPKLHSRLSAAFKRSKTAARTPRHRIPSRSLFPLCVKFRWNKQTKVSPCGASVRRREAGLSMSPLFARGLAFWAFLLGL